MRVAYAIKSMMGSFLKPELTSLIPWIVISGCDHLRYSSLAMGYRAR